MAMIDEISGFYRDIVAPQRWTVTPQDTTTTLYPISRIDFLAGSGIATAFLVENVVFTALLLVANIFTCFLITSLRTSLSQTVQEMPKYLGAIPLGLVGAMFPQTVNEKVLQIPAGGLNYV